jgi:hypothetical protein
MKALMRTAAFVSLILTTALTGESPAASLSLVSLIQPAGLSLGRTDLLGTTWHDSQHNGSIGRMISMTPGGGLHFCWMNGLDSLATSRHVFYNYWNPTIGDLAWPDIGFQIDQGYRGGYSNVSNFSTGEVLVACHVQDYPGTDWYIMIFTDIMEGFGPFWSAIENPSWGQMSWPKMAVCGRDFIHIVGFENSDHQYDRIAYARSEDGGMRFSEWEIIDTLLTQSVEIAASPMSNKVGIAYTKPSFFVPPDPPWWQGWFLPLTSDVYLVESEDGVSWDFSARQNITAVILADTSRYPDTTWANGDTLRAYCDVSLLYDRDDQAHLAFTTRGFWQEADRAVLPDSFFRVDVSRDASMIWHWSEAHDTLTRIADGWYDVGDPAADLNEYRGAGNYRSTVDRPSLAEDPETGYLYCIYTRCVQGDTSGGPAPSHGWANGEIYCSVSTDGGLNWTQGINLTNTPSPGCTPGNCFDEDYASQTRVVDDTLHIIYIEDKDAGGVVWTAPQEGIWTENPVIYQKVPADLIPPGPPYVPNYYFHVGPVGATGVGEPQRVSSVTPKEFVLHPNYPNPFNAATEIGYQIPRAGRVTLKVFNTLGQEVRTLLDGRQEAGEHKIRWDGQDANGQDVASGLYFCRMEVGKFRKTVKMVLVR